MAMFVHLTVESHIARIRRNGIGRLRPAAGVSEKGVFAVPITRSFYGSHQWLRELKRRNEGPIAGVYFAFPMASWSGLDTMGRFHRRLTAAQALAQFTAASLQVSPMFWGPPATTKFPLASSSAREENIGAMGTRDKRVDAYIANSADFAQPVLRHLREIVHEGCPEVEETMKWSFPHFDYKGMMCSMASFKQHCAFGFWKGSLIFDGKQDKDAMGQFGRITSVKDLPAKSVLLGYIRKARQLNDEGVKIARPPKPKEDKKDLVVPDYFQTALKKNKKALATFETFPYSKKKDYVQWLTEAKSDETRERRLETSIQWLAEGKSRNWKYERSN